MCDQFNISYNQRDATVQMRKKLSKYQEALKKRYTAAGFHKQEIVFFDIDTIQPKFTSMCCQDDDLIFAASPNLQSILNFSIIRDGYGVQGTTLAMIAYDTEWAKISSMCLFDNSLFFITPKGIIKLRMEDHTISSAIDNDAFGGKAYQIKSTTSSVIFSDPVTRKIYSFDPSNGHDLVVFAGDGQDKHVDGPHFACSFKQPCGLAVEFGEVVYVTDATSASVNIITKFEKNVQFLRALGGLYDAFSVHSKGAKYIRNNLLDALALIGPCFSFLDGNQKDIRSSVPNQLPANLQGPQGNIASKTIVSVGLVQWGVSRLYEITEKYSYSSADLPTMWSTCIPSHTLNLLP